MIKKVFFLLFPFVCLFYCKQKISECNQHNRNLAQKIIELDENIKVLKAEWAFLNAPQRLKRLAIEVLGMKPIELKQMKHDPS